MDSFIKYEEFPTLKEAQEKFTNSSEVKAKIFPSKNTSVATKFDQNKDKPLKVKSCEASTEGGKEVGGIKSKVDCGDGAPQERTKNAGNKTKSTGRGCDFGDRRGRQDPNRSIDSYNIKGSGKTVSSHDKMNFVHHQGVKGLYEESLGNVTNVNHGNKNRKQKASVLENDTFDLPPEVKSEYIHKLKERNSSWPLAKYFCGLCNYHMKNLSVVERHRKDERHMSLLEASDFLDTLVFIPKPTEAQSCVISTTLKNLQESIQMKTQNFSLRQSLVYNLERSLSQKYPDWKIELHLYGSSRTGFALIDSDVNIGFISNVSTSEMYAAFKDILGFLKTNPDYESVTLEWHNNTPVLYLEDAQSKLLCKVSAFSQEFIKTSLFLQACVEKEPRLLTVGLAFRYWARLCNLDDEKSGLLPPNAFILMCVYYFQAQRVLPFLQPQASKHTSSQPPAPESSTNKVSVTTVQEEHQKLTNLLAKWKTSNNESVGKLWLGLLRFYAIDFKYKKKIVSLRDKNLTRGDKGWSHSRFAIEDPYVIKKNVAGGISHSNVTLHIFLVLKHTYKYFATPQLEGGSLFKFLDIKRGPIPRGRVHNRSVGEEGEEDDDDDDDDNGQEDIQDSLASNLNELNLDYSIGPETDPIKLSTLSKEARNRLAPDIAYKLCRQFVQTDLKYKFDVQEFTQGKDPPIMCAICQKKGHLKDECPDLILPPILPRQELSKKFKNLLSKVCSEVYREWNPTQHELNISQNFFKQIEKVVLKYNPSAVLEQFGSLMNGFGLKSSDVDICMTFKDNKSGEMIDQVKIIQELASHLQKSPYFSYVIPIMSAKVPIVKFSDLRGVLEGDISLYNTLALHNTRMLKLYSTIDERLRVLGFVIKIFAKVCQIGDASKGSLSSYAYILMLIYYLQQRNPPVLPVLQELYDKTLPKPERMVNGANIWYREDISDLGKIWPHYGKNTESIGQLWVGLLKFYSDEFNFDEHVVCIRQLNKMSKMEKLWCSKTFAIEDPFDLNHNLGSGLSRKMYVYIRRSFIRSFHHFSTSLDHLEGYRSAVEYFFDRNCLTYGPPPSDRVCRKCGTLGHLVKRCPFLEENKSRKKIDNLLEWPRKQAAGGKLKLTEDVEMPAFTERKKQRADNHDPVLTSSRVKTEEKRPYRGAFDKVDYGRFENSRYRGRQQNQYRQHSQKTRGLPDTCSTQVPFNGYQEFVDDVRVYPESTAVKLKRKGKFRMDFQNYRTTLSSSEDGRATSDEMMDCSETVKSKQTDNDLLKKKLRKKKSKPESSKAQGFDHGSAKVFVNNSLKTTDSNVTESAGSQPGVWRDYSVEFSSSDEATRENFDKNSEQPAKLINKKPKIKHISVHKPAYIHPDEYRKRSNESRGKARKTPSESLISRNNTPRGYPPSTAGVVREMRVEDVSENALRPSSIHQPKDLSSSVSHSELDSLKFKNPKGTGTMKKCITEKSGYTRRPGFRIKVQDMPSGFQQRPLLPGCSD